MDINKISKNFYHYYMWLQQEAVRGEGSAFFSKQYDILQHEFVREFNAWCLGGLFVLKNVELEWIDESNGQGLWDTFDFTIYLVLDYESHIEKMRYKHDTLVVSVNPSVLSDFTFTFGTLPAVFSALSQLNLGKQAQTALQRVISTYKECEDNPFFRPEKEIAIEKNRLVRATKELCQSILPLLSPKVCEQE